MASVRITNSDHVEAHSTAVCDSSARLSLKPGSSARGALDGAWWPRSRDPAIELAALIEAVGAQRGTIRQLALNRADWDSAPRRIRLDSGRRISVDWSSILGVHIVRIVDTDYQWIDLLLVPVGTEQAIADLALTMATDGQDPNVAAADGHRSAPACQQRK